MPLYTHNTTLSLSRSTSPEIILSVTTSPSKLIKVACNYEVERNQALAEARLLRRKLADITDNDDYSNQSTHEDPPKKKFHQDNAQALREQQIVHAGNRFVMLKGLWLIKGEKTFQIEIEPDFEEDDQFEDEEHRVQGQLRDVADVLEKELESLDEISQPWVSKSFIHGMNAQCSNTATRLRHSCAMLFEVSETDILDSATRKMKFREKIGWVLNEYGVGSYSDVDVEILHQNFTGSFNPSTAFLNPNLMRIFVAIIRGPTAAKELMKGGSSIPKTDTMAQRHQIRNTTPGAIAGCAILARWALSADELLQSVGNKTGIHYAKDFDAYLELLLIGLREKRASTLRNQAWVEKIADCSSGLQRAKELLAADNVEGEEIDYDIGNECANGEVPVVEREDIN